jgi:hypothetical protein
VSAMPGPIIPVPITIARSNLIVTIAEPHIPD